MRSASKPTSKTARPLTARLMRLEPRDKPYVPSAKSRRVRKNKWVVA
jgi:hypothetical protein